MLKEPGASTRSRETRSRIHGPHRPDQPHSPGSPGPARGLITICWCYLDLTEWLQQYISYYAQLTESLQWRKIILLQNDFIKEKSRQNCEQYCEAQMRQRFNLFMKLLIKIVCFIIWMIAEWSVHTTVSAKLLFIIWWIFLTVQTRQAISSLMSQ